MSKVKVGLGENKDKKGKASGKARMIKFDADFCLLGEN